MEIEPQKNVYRVYLANPRTRPKIEQICREAGYVPPYIGSPQAIMEELL